MEEAVRREEEAEEEEDGGVRFKCTQPNCAKQTHSFVENSSGP